MRGKIIRTRPDCPLGSIQPSVQWVTDLLPGSKGLGPIIDHLPHLKLRLQKQLYSSIPLLELRGLFRGELYFLRLFQFYATLLTDFVSVILNVKE